MKFYKNKNPNTTRLSLLFVYQVVLGALPAILFIIYVIYVQRVDISAQDMDELNYTLLLGVVFIAFMFLAFTGYIALGRKYNVLVSGFRGERLLGKIAKQLNGDYIVFTNLPIRYKNNRSELDLLIVSEQGILVVEVKNHSGAIIGADNDEFWIHRKYYRKGVITETEMKNPLKQVKRQREILKNILRSNGIDVWIDSVLFFSSNPTLRLRVVPAIGIATSEDEMLGLIANYDCDGKKPTAAECEEIAKILQNHKIS
jgi:hypothetical protein